MKLIPNWMRVQTIAAVKAAILHQAHRDLIQAELIYDSAHAQLMARRKTVNRLTRELAASPPSNVRALTVRAS